jgi:hypothetical protein
MVNNHQTWLIHNVREAKILSTVSHFWKNFRNSASSPQHIGKTERREKICHSMCFCKASSNKHPIMTTNNDPSCKVSLKSISLGLSIIAPQSRVEESVVSSEELMTAQMLLPFLNTSVLHPKLLKIGQFGMQIMFCRCILSFAGLEFTINLP